MGESGGSRGARRLVELDGLRGVAALIVVFSHVSAAVLLPTTGASSVADAFQRVASLEGFGVLTNGDAAVTVFFVLSGLVLAAPWVRSRPRGSAARRRWLAYYPSRVVRLMVPVWGSLVLAVVLFVLVPRHGGADMTPWMAEHEGQLTLRRLAKAALLQRPGMLNSPLWSLWWEMAFSLFLPVFVLVALSVRGHWTAIAWATLACALVAVGDAVGSRSLTYLPQFLVGAALAHETVTGHVPRVRPRLAWPLLVLLLAGVQVTSLAKGLPGLVGPAALGARTALAAGLVVLVLCWGGGNPFRSRIAAWLGLMSFSLYLVHEPIIVTLRYVLPGAGSFVWLALVGVPASLLAAVAFHRLCEEPAHRMSRAVARLIRSS